MYHSTHDKESEYLFDYSDKPLLFSKFPHDPCSSPELTSSTTTSDNMCTPPSTEPCFSFTDNECLELMESQNNGNSLKRQTSPNKAERRAEHNAIERARRECLNSKFQQLAETLPNLHTYRRPSKGQIVEKALDWVKESRKKEERYQQEIRQLQDENKRLMALGKTKTSSLSPDPNFIRLSNDSNDFEKGFYHNSAQKAFMAYPEASMANWKYDSRQDGLDYSLSENLASRKEDACKSTEKECLEVLFKDPFSELASCDMINSSAYSPWEKDQSYSVCSHPSNNSFNSIYYHPPYLS